MSWTDLFMAGAIILGALYLLYRSLCKKPGCCSECQAGCCPGKQLEDEKK
jgi:hypothetical protein